MANITGNPWDETLFGTFGNDNIVALEGNDKIFAGWGHDDVFGDVKNVSLDFISQSTITPTIYDSTSAVHMLIPNFGNDKLYGQGGHDALYGDAKTFDINVLGTDNAAAGVDASVAVFDLNVTFGNDKLYGGSGHDELYGDTKDFSVTLDAGDNAGIGSNASTVLGFDPTLFLFGRPNPFTDPALMGGVQNGLSVTFGDDILRGGSGHDDIYGDTKNLSIDVGGGNMADGAAAISWLYYNQIDFGNDTLMGGWGEDTLYGDAKDVDINVSAGSGGGNWVSGVYSLPLLFGDDILKGGEGGDVLYGDAQDFNITLKGGDDISYNPDPSAFPFVGFPVGEGLLSAVDFGLTGPKDMFVFGHDTLYGGWGHDTLYGDVKNLDIEVTGGELNITSAAPSIIGTGNMQLSNTLFGSDLLYGGEGDDTLYGDVQNLNFNLNAGGGSTLNTSVSHGIITGVAFTFGNDVLNGGGGDDTLYGDTKNLNINLIAADSTTGFASGNWLGTNLLFGADTLYGGEGDDTLYGDVKDFNMYIKGGDNNGYFSLFHGNAQISFAGDTLDGGWGDDALYGDAKSLTLDFQGGNNTSSAVNQFGSSARILNGDIAFGADTLYGGHGDDELYGDAKDFLMDFKGGDNASNGVAADATFAAINSLDAPTTMIFGNDLLDGGQGHDLLVGDVENLEMNFEAGHGSVGSFAGPNGATLSLAAISGVPITFGDDELYGGGGHDEMYGDVKSWDMNFQGGLNADGAGAALVSSAGIVPDLLGNPTGMVLFGNDMMEGGNGYDLMYGEGETMALEAHGGTVTAPGALVNVRAGLLGTPITFGDDVMKGGNGGDELYGDWENLEITLVDGTGPGLTDAAFETVKFGDDTIDGGEGHDFIVGDVADVWHSHTDFGGTDLGNSFVEDTAVTWGNDILTGGWGDDTFFFEIQDNGGDMQMQGDDIITDLEAWDTLEFADVLDVNGGGVDLSDLDDQTIFTDDGTDVRIDFAGGGSLTLEGVGTGSISTFSDLENETGAQVVV